MSAYNGFMALVRACAVLIALCGAAAPAAALTVQFGGQDRVLVQNGYEFPFGVPTVPMLPPGDVAMIDDWYHNTTLNYSGAGPGSSLGIRATSPTGVVTTNVVTWSTVTNCWLSGLSQTCPALPDWTWWLGTTINFRPVGQWKVDVLANGAVVHTFFFQLKPYTLQQVNQSVQSISVRATAPQPLIVRLTYPDGTPAPGKVINFNVTAKPRNASPSGGLTTSSTYSGTSQQSLQVATTSDGKAQAYFETGGKEGDYVVTVSTPLAPGVSRVFTVKAVAPPPPPDPDPPKNLPDGPPENGNCGRQTNANTPNPINIATGNKWARELDYDGSGPLPLHMSRFYNSKSPRAGSFGANWRGFYDRSVIVTTTVVNNKTTTTARVVRNNGRELTYTLTNGNWVGDPDIIDRLQNLSGGGLRFICGNDDMEDYASNGRLLSVSARDGFTQTLSYDAQGRLSQVTDAFGRSLTFTYDAANRVATMTDPAGRTTTYTYAANGTLVAVQYPDLRTRGYHYEDGRFPSALTGITDENLVRLSTYAYNADGRAVSSMRAGGALPATVLYYNDGSRSVLDGLGNYRRYTFSTIQKVARRTSMDNAACVSCGNAASTTGYNTNGFVTSVTDYRGTQTTFVRDARGLETSRTEAMGKPEQRTITTTWHATFRLPLTITRPGQRTSFTYDGAGRMLTRTITDTATNAARTWTYAYNAQGLLASENGPRSDVSDITTYAYTAQGNLSTVTNALGHVTRYTSHDAHGRPLSMTDPNGLVTTFTYDLRGRLLTRNAGGLLTSFTYTAAGQPLRTTQPDGSWVERQYDAAQQEIGLIDSAGQRIAYTLDGNGRRVREEHFDAFNASVYQRGWSHDSLGRVLTEIDAQGAVQWRHAYDANGNRTSSADPFGNVSARAYDNLDRPASVTDPLGALTSYAHDARDNLTRVTDPRGVVTQYTFDGLDNLTQEASPDAGTSGFTYDSAGNLKTRTWANGRAVTYTLDALNRVTLESYGGGVQVSLLYDGGPNGLGRRTGASDPGGANTWSHDLWGRVTQAVRVSGSRGLVTGYGYDSAGRLASMSYPSGRVIGYGYDGAGRVAAMSVDGQPLLTGVAWQPFGGPRGWSQGNGRVVARTYDRDGRLKTQSFDVGSRTYGYDLKGRLTSIAEPWGTRTYGYDAADRLASESGWAGAHAYSWDGNGNRQGQTSPQGSTSYAYEPGTNRLQSAAGVDARAFSHDTAGNMSAEGGYGYAYDARNRLAQATSPAATTNYGHDALGRRAVKSNTSTRYYAHDEGRKVIGEYDQTSALTETVWLGSTPVAVLRSGQTYWIDADQIDTPRAVLNASNQIVWRWRSEAFGNTQVEDNPSGLGGFEFNHRFPGQMFDAETALHHNDHRDYRAHVGRYIESDPIGLQGGVNRFAYVRGMPVSLVDELGLAPSCEGQWVLHSTYVPNMPLPSRRMQGASVPSWRCTCYWICEPCRGGYVWSGDRNDLPSTAGNTIIDYGSDNPPNAGNAGHKPTRGGPSRGPSGASGGAYTCMCSKPSKGESCLACYKDYVPR